jgi:hypothetical protein
MMLAFGAGIRSRFREVPSQVWEGGGALFYEAIRARLCSSCHRRGKRILTTILRGDSMRRFFSAAAYIALAVVLLWLVMFLTGWTP